MKYSLEKIVLGTVQLGIAYGINNRTGKPSMEEGVAILNEAYRYGIRYLDTAEGYGDSQKVIGKYHDLFTSNAFGVITKLASANLARYSNITDIIQENLREVGLHFLEGYMFHSHKDFVSCIHIFRELSVLKEKGIIKQIGVSVYTNKEADAILTYKGVDFIQLPYNILDNFSLRGDILKKAKSNNVSVHVRSVFLQGLFHMDFNRMPAKLQPLLNYLGPLKKLAEENSMSLPEMALQYVFSNPYIDKALIGVDTADQLRWNISVLKKNGISENVQEVINSIRVAESSLLNPVNWK
jgi:aryl-alcohol dehydrogenase-like predicted oxidoreductase